ncbi:MAG TPA: isochorismatase family cysteine hydrolase [Chthoniobacteraceae bacterium]
MPKLNPDLHGSAPDRSPVVLLLIDVINDMEFEGGEKLLKHALPAARKIAALKKRAKAAGVPAIYVNDNFGRWQSDFTKLVRHCLEDGVRGAPITEILQPEEEDYFVLKPKHSGFFASSLDILLQYLGAETLILTGFAGNLCVLYTANDAYMRDYSLIVPSDCMASEIARANVYALDQMKRYLKAKTSPSSRVRFEPGPDGAQP